MQFTAWRGPLIWLPSPAPAGDTHRVSPRSGNKTGRAGSCKTRPPLSVILVAADFIPQRSAMVCTPAHHWAVLHTSAWKRSDLAPTATTPGRAAASAAATAPAASPAAPAAATSAAATPATPGNFLADLRRCGIFLVEHVERRQADVRDFLLAKKDLMIRRGILRRDIRRDSTSRCGRSARQRQRQPGSPQHRYCFASPLSLRSLLGTRHLGFSHTFEATFRSIASCERKDFTLGPAC